MPRLSARFVLVIFMKNRSNMNITQVRYQMVGYDIQGEQIQMGPQDLMLTGSHDDPPAPGEATKHGQFSFCRPAEYVGLGHPSLAITGWLARAGITTTTATCATAITWWKRSIPG